MDGTKIRAALGSWSGWKSFLLAAMFQLLLPLVAFLPEALRTGTVSIKTLGAGATVYILGLAVSCRDRLAFGTGLFAGVVSAVAFGADPAFIDPTTTQGNWGHKLPFVLISVAALGFVVDRAYYHVKTGETFGPFKS
jgi:hypothetical protein